MPRSLTFAQVGERVRQTRLARGLSQGELAERLGLDRSAVGRLESGERKITALELLTLSSTLGASMEHLLSRSPEAVVSRRAPLSDGSVQSERAAAVADIELEEQWRDLELLRRTGHLQAVPTEPEASVATSDDARRLAARARAWLSQPDEPLPSLLDVCAQFGLHVRVVDSAVEGASLSPERGLGVAVVGATLAPGRRRATAAHELGHHVLGDAYQVDVGAASTKDERERLIDAFAAELLLPSSRARAALDVSGRDRWEALVRLAGTYRVSWSLACTQAGVTDGEVPRRQPRKGDFVRVLGYEPREDLTSGSTSSVWQRAVLSAHAAGDVTGARAVELLRGSMTVDELSDVTEPPP